MAPEIQRFPATADPALINAAIERDGGVIVTGLINPEQLKELNAQLDPLVEEQREYRKQAEFQEDGIRKESVLVLPSLLLKLPMYRELLHNEVVLNACDHLLLPNCTSYQFSSGNLLQIEYTEADGSEMALHRDDGIWTLPEPRCDAQIVTMFALTDFTRENGATAFAPGSHRWDDAKRTLRPDGYNISDEDLAKLRFPKPEEITYAEMEAGSALIFLGNAWHGATGNRTHTPRRGMYMGYILGWLRQEENMPMTLPLEEVLKLPDETLKLIGYEGYGGGVIGKVGTYERPPEFIARKRKEFGIKPGGEG